MKKGKLLLITILAGLLLLLGACGNEEKKSEAKGVDSYPKEIRIGYQVIPNAELLAKSLKLYEKAFEGTGTKIVWHQFESAKDVNTAITSKSIDVGLIGSSSVSTGIAQNLPYEVVWIHDVIGDNEALVTKKDANIHSIKDVVGKKIAVPFGSTTHYSFLSALALNHIDPSKVTILDMQPQDMLAAYLQGQIDGGYVWYPILDEMLPKGNIVLTSRELAEKGVVTADIGVMRKEFAKEYPKAAEKYIGALDEAVKYYRSNESDAVKSMAKELNVSEEDASKFMKQLIWLDASEQSSKDYLGTPDKKGALAKALQDTAKFMVKQKAIDSAPNVKAFGEGINAKFVTDVAKEK